MKLSSTIIEVVRKTYGEYSPEKHDPLVQNLLQKLGPILNYRVEENLHKHIGKMALTYAASFDPTEVAARVMIVIAAELVWVACALEPSYKGDIKKLVHGIIDDSFAVASKKT